jgi:hypothetical protein
VIGSSAGREKIGKIVGFKNHSRKIFKRPDEKRGRRGTRRRVKN